MSLWMSPWMPPWMPPWMSWWVSWWMSLVWSLFLRIFSWSLNAFLLSETSGTFCHRICHVLAHLFAFVRAVCLLRRLPSGQQRRVRSPQSTAIYTSSTAQGGGGSFKNRKPIGEIGCCESRMAEQIHWWTERWLELCFLEWLQWLQWSPGRSPHPQLLDVVWCSAAVVVVVV